MAGLCGSRALEGGLAAVASGDHRKAGGLRRPREVVDGAAGILDAFLDHDTNERAAADHGGPELGYVAAKVGTDRARRLTIISRMLVILR